MLRYRALRARAATYQGRLPEAEISGAVARSIAPVSSRDRNRSISRSVMPWATRPSRTWTVFARSSALTASNASGK